MRLPITSPGELPVPSCKKSLKALTTSMYIDIRKRQTACHSNQCLHSQYFNEIMPTVYRRFTEKESKQWRQIYKVL